VGHEYSDRVLRALIMSRVGKAQCDNRMKEKANVVESEGEVEVAKKRPTLVKLDKGMNAVMRNKEFSQCVYVCR
jgi:hypothetical protein